MKRTLAILLAAVLAIPAFSAPAVDADQSVISKHHGSGGKGGGGGGGGKGGDGTKGGGRR